MRGFAFTFLISAAAVACAQQFGQSFGPPIHWQEYKSGSSVTILRDTTTVIGNANTWELFWSRLTGNKPAAVPRNIDFTKEEAVVVVLGSRAPGTSVVIQSIDRSDPARLVVSYVEQPAQVALAGNLKISPYDVVKLERAGESNVSFSGSLAPRFNALWQGLNGDCWWSPYRWDSSCRQQSPDTVVIEDQNGFNEYWQNSQGQPYAPSNVDFAQYRLVAIHAGISALGTGIFIDSVHKTKSGKIQVAYHLGAPQNADPSQKASPYVILLVPRTAGGVTVLRR